MKDWSKERWRKLYLREALEQRLWSVMARGLRDYLIRLAEDDGALIRDAEEPVEALLTVLPAPRSADRQRVQQILVADLVLFTDDLRRAHTGNEIELGANFAEVVIVTHDLFPFRHCYLLLNDAPRATLETHNTIASSRSPYSPPDETRYFRAIGAAPSQARNRTSPR